jgi:bla regulator protein BlaR1
MIPSIPAVLVEVLGWCLVHFLWQGLLVGLFYAAARMVLPRGNPRYFAAMIAMVLLAAVPIATGWHEFRVLAEPVVLGDAVVPGGAGAAAVPPAAVGYADWLTTLRIALPWLVLAWVCGVLFLVGRVLRQWSGLRAIVRAAEALPDWQHRAQRLGRKLGLRHAIRILASARIATPTLVGWVRPVIVVPFALLAQMPAEQVDLILVHELAHLRRLDHLANLFQVAVETLLFYHPVVHWISRDARNERELCCDALALQATGGKRRDFVAALAGLAEFRTGHPELALAASGGLLVERAWFIAGTVPERRRGHASLTVAGLALLGLAIALGLAWRQELVQQRAEDVLAANRLALRQSLDGAPVPTLPLAYGVPGWHPDLLPVLLARVAAPMPGTIIPPPRVLQAVAPPPSLAVPDVEPARSSPAFRAARLREPATPSVSAALPVKPRTIYTVPPAYPARALLDGVQGRVEIQFGLSATGVPENLQVVESSASGRLDAAALTALSRWRFAPPAVAGRQYRQAFTFRVGGAAGATDAAATQDCLPSTGTHICRYLFDTEAGVHVLKPSH